MNLFDLSGKRALVTGASGGIGQAIAQTLAKQGVRVALSGTRIDALEKVAQAVGENAVIVPANLSDAASVEALVKSSEEKLGGPIDILINNAGLTRDGLAMRMKNEDWQSVIDVNLTAAFILSRAVLRSMMKNRWGRIISITSVVGVTGNAGQANYAASKAGLIGMSKALALEVASRGVTVNCVAPGFIATAMTDALNDEQKNAISSKIPAGTMGCSDDIAAAVLYLASQEARYVTGQTLHVNGGMAMV